MIKSWEKDKLLAGFSNHFMDEVNSTLPYFPPLMYVFARAHDCKNILEVGIERGYSTYYLAHAAKMSGGMYYGIDNEARYCENIDRELTKANLPHKIICADTKKMEKIDFVERIDFAFLDGEHTTEAVMHEIDLIYPLLVASGWGYIFIHDIVDMGNAGAWLKLKNDKRFETLGLNPNYGLGIARKMENVDYEDVARRFEVKTNYMPRWKTLENLIKRNNSKVIAEIGVDKGETTKYLLEHCDLEKYVLVDSSFNLELEKELEGKSVEIQKMTSLEASKLYEDETFDFIFIDADHQFKSVSEDIEAWIPKVKKGGVISGHDYFRTGDRPDTQVASAVFKIFGYVNLISDEGPNSDRCVWWQYRN